ncbi:Holliday junction branch migration protein RuvA [Gymnodinialimonas ceratoperidinii]|uniref:Holliday junction branch migration complex subunit RuvA n=1 Tax=Gymnodinialimonas ceratoperidinii TaxID=2856823 RepID=A0A8F6YA92_9RHOB|nr:Holliday junction branch migration protein RuvA [Gymnodinialimonas ceratoperidinii]QXT39338.1 Holliday junction branch migration protein RuvA [Gymnodinialimonas ceratoperidinii]
MIGKLTGRLDYKASDHALIDVGGVGYVVHCSDRTLAALPGSGEIVSLYTEMLVREDLLQLFGFVTPYEKEWHRLLTSVQGVGAKASMAILGTLGAEGASRAITLGDATAIKAAPGVGPKLAQRVVMELKDKAPAVMAMGGTLDAAMDAVVEDDRPGDAAPAKPAPVRRPASNAQAEALSALQNLGYGPSDAAQAVAQAAENASDTADLIRQALRLLAPKD